MNFSRITKKMITLHKFFKLKSMNIVLKMRGLVVASPKKITFFTPKRNLFHFYTYNRVTGKVPSCCESKKSLQRGGYCPC